MFVGDQPKKNKNKKEHGNLKWIGGGEGRGGGRFAKTHIDAISPKEKITKPKPIKVQT